MPRFNSLRKELDAAAREAGLARCPGCGCLLPGAPGMADRPEVIGPLVDELRECVDQARHRDAVMTEAERAQQAAFFADLDARPPVLSPTAEVPV